MEKIDNNLWVEWLKSKGLSDNTVRQYIYYYDKFDFERYTMLPQFLMARIYDWIKTDVSPYRTKDDLLFDITRQRFCKILHNSSMKVIGRKINIHLLRHSFA